jgi:hypothetical protein
MFRNYFEIAWRNLTKNKVHSFISISGLFADKAIARLIAISSFSQYYQNYTRAHCSRSRKVLMTPNHSYKLNTKQVYHDPKLF